MKPQSGAELDALEVVQPPAHGFGSGLSVITVPSAEPGNDPGGEGEGTFGVRVFLAGSPPFEFSRQSLQNGLIVRFEGIGQLRNPVADQS